ncbi:MAG TPA: right-handed parallel beta-helix repeat-containing protein [Geminicoccaceae bacterium]|nr:right-handed parallel beta-helix repeat-containing protein [Geminicoccus sp.]HMU52058.1 right-handed parallel beta-helix repeat-containing protein [Geminicoccaceae bacterium]
MIRLTADCTTTATINVPGGFTFDGQNHTITALDPPAGSFQGAVLKALPGAAVTIRKVKIEANNLAVACHSGDARLAGILFDGASGKVTNTSVLSLNQGASGCQEGLAISIRNAPFDGTNPATKRVSVTNNIVRGWQKGGIIANGDVDVEITGNDVGESATQHNLSANSVQLAYGAKGKIQNNDIAGNQNLIPGGADGSSAMAILIYGAPGAIVHNNRIGGNSNIGIGVYEDIFFGNGGSVGVKITQNRVFDEGADDGDISEDTGIAVDQESRPKSSVRTNTIRCFDVPVEIEGGSPTTLGNNKVQNCATNSVAALRAAASGTKAVAAKAKQASGPSPIKP